VIAGDAIHAGSGQAFAAEDVPAADDHADFGAGPLHVDDFARQARQDFRVDAVVGVAEQRLAAEFQEDTFVFCVGGHAGVSTGRRAKRRYSSLTRPAAPDAPMQNGR
jgi:hypothetical protein